MKQAKLLLVALEVLQPGVEFQVLQLIFEPAADLEGFPKFFVLRFDVLKLELVGFGALGWGSLKVADFLLEAFHLGDGPLHGDLERFDGTFESFEEIDLHHADQEFFAVGLTEGVAGVGLVKRLEFLFDVA